MTCYNSLLVDRYTDNRDEREWGADDSQEHKDLRQILMIWVYHHEPKAIALDLFQMFGRSITITEDAVNRALKPLIGASEAQKDPWWIWGHKDTLQRWGLEMVIAEIGQMGLYLESASLNPIQSMPGDDF